MGSPRYRSPSLAGAVVALLAAAAAAGASQQRVYPDDRLQCTGTLYEYFWVNPPSWEWEIYDGDLYLDYEYDQQTRPQWYKEWSGFAKFNLSAVPDSATIAEVAFGCNQTAVVGNFRYSYEVYDCDPETCSAEQLGNAGRTHLALGAQHPSQGWIRETWPDTAARLVQERLGTDRLAIALNHCAGSGTIAGHGSTSPPFLTIGYYFPHGCDATPLAVLAPVGRIGFNAAVRPQVLVRNCGPTALELPVRLAIGTDYADTTNVTIPGGSSAVVEFRNWTSTIGGCFEMRCSTMFDSDSVPANDLLIDSCEVGVVVGADDSGVLHPRPALSVGPNPLVGRWVTLKWGNGSAPATARVGVVDASGRTVLVRRVSLSGPYGLARLDLGKLPRGAYVLRASQGTASAVCKFTVCR